MGLVKVITTDMFELEHVVDYFCNPVNLVGALGKGLAVEFKTRCPSYIEPYREACKTGELRVGTVQVVEDSNQRWGVISVPTKRHYADTSYIDDITRSIEALRALLKENKYKYAVVGVPMLGTGLGKTPYEEVYPMMIDCLSDLDATVLLHMSPERTEQRPRYLCIVGGDGYHLTSEDAVELPRKIHKVMEIWKSNLSEYEAILTGSPNGVFDKVGQVVKQVSTAESLISLVHDKKPLIIRPNEVRNGSAANLLQGDLLCELAEDIILFKPKGYNNNRMIAMQMKIEEINKKRLELGLPKKRLAVLGDISTKLYDDNILVPVVGYDDE